MLFAAAAHAETATASSHSEVLCTILLIATVIAFIVGLCEAVGFTRFTGAGNGRFGTLVVAVILLVVYLFVC